jgi:hypothetical protein
MFSLEGIGPERCLEGSRRPYYYDRYTDRLAMVYLRWGKGRPPTSTTTTTIHARITQEEVRRRIKHVYPKIREFLPVSHYPPPHRLF